MGEEEKGMLGASPLMSEAEMKNGRLCAVFPFLQKIRLACTLN